MALRFSAAHNDVVRVPHELSMNGPLISSWTVELWLLAAEHQQPPASGRHVTLVSFPGRHPSLSLSTDGFATASLRTTNGSWYSYEGSTPLNDGKWHHVAATWDGTDDEPSNRELYLYVDGQLEAPGDEDEDGLQGPKTPEAIGYEVMRDCVDGMCEEGMQIGGLYCCGGEAYTGQFFNGTLDEVRVWSRALGWPEITARMNDPLYAGDQDQLLFYFPMDEAGMEMGSNVIQSTALYWYGMLGNTLGGGRPTWIESSAPLSCSEGSRAPVCVRLATYGAPQNAAAPMRYYSFGTSLFYVLLAAAVGAAVGAVSTYTSVTGQLPPAIARACYCLDFLPFAGYSAARSASLDRPNDWTWATPPREQPPSSRPTPSSTPRTYGGV
eukprot:CAMPEP_0113242676 /NCGR_PEP_ID=MMETSP0008_2-20120614/7456_1 /TAXON_ID=97485 /ORGANISM="Prymnesium parvum" /LENGTH=381 /DNA_ID=CAMNT_0000090165 /DNA_START=11 /DNA_END=1156 /DNA_ORIENTATION=+ /assembly_acc=CAM_ASM_000153